MLWCCCDDCTLYRDLFNRDDADDPGSAWTVDAGDWPIVDQDLEPTTNSAITPDFEHSDTEVSIKVPFVVETDEATFRVCFEYSDQDNYQFVELVVSNSDGSLNYGSRSGGTDSLSIEIPRNLTYGGEYELRVCYNGTNLLANVVPSSASFEGDAIVAFKTAASISDTTLGLATRTVTGTLKIKSFHVYDYADGCLGCLDPTGCSVCHNGQSPNEYHVEVANVGGSACPLDECDRFNATFILDPALGTACGPQAFATLPAQNGLDPTFECGEVDGWIMTLSFGVNAPYPAPFDFIVGKDYVQVTLASPGPDGPAVCQNFIRWMKDIPADKVTGADQIHCFALLDGFELPISYGFDFWSNATCNGGNPVCDFNTASTATITAFLVDN